MKNLLKKSAVSLFVAGTLLSLVNESFAREGRRGGGRRGGGNDSSDGYRDNFRGWQCRGDARDGSELFFLSMGRSYGEAYAKVLEKCNRQNRNCSIDCARGLTGIW